jgi:polyisoprenoid-binding protein YceI
MKKVTLTVLTIGIIFASCSNNGKQVEANEAKTVEIVKNEVTTELKTIKENSNVDWRASHLGGVQKRFGKISLKSAELLVNDNHLSNATVTLDMSSFTVDNFVDDEESTNKLRGHLMSDDFFNVEVYPTSTFELTNIETVEGDYNSTIIGNLTIMETTKSISFNANVTVSENEVSIQSEDFAVNRTDWGLTYNVEGTEGVPVDYLIANDLGFTINVTVTK